MKNLIKIINRKADEMDQGTFNVYCSIFIAVFILIPMFIVGFSWWANLYLE